MVECTITGNLSSYGPRVLEAMMRGLQSAVLHVLSPDAQLPSGPIHVVTERDGWDWAGIVLAGVAAVGAAVIVFTWWTKQRRTPEVQFSWRANGQAWSSDGVQTIPRFGALDVQLGLTNVGTGAAKRLVINVVVPSWVKLTVVSRKPGPILTADEPNVGFSATAARYRVLRSKDFFPAMDLAVRFSLGTATQTPPGVSSWVVVSVEAEGLTANGVRGWPSFLAPKPAEKRVEFWGSPDWRRLRYRPPYLPGWLRRAKVEPRNEVRCGPGRRMVRRPIQPEWVTD